MIDKIAPLLERHRQSLSQIIGSDISDDDLRRVAEFVHPHLPLVVRMTLKPDKLAMLLIENRARIVPHLTAK